MEQEAPQEAVPEVPQEAVPEVPQEAVPEVPQEAVPEAVCPVQIPVIQVLRLAADLAPEAARVRAAALHGQSLGT